MVSPQGPLLLLTDDDAPFRKRLAAALRERGYEVVEADCLADAVRRAEAESPEMALVDLRLPDGGGLELVQRLKAIDASTRIVVLTGYGSIATALEAIRLGAVHYLTKPAAPDEILAAFDGVGSGTTIRTGNVEDGPATPTLARTEWEHIQRVLTDCDGNISEAARRLGIHRRSLQRKLSKFPSER